ncbi:lipin Ned1 [Gnomoniopsis smithogilvyi]|uniref:Lipin Ned1 n=1 Tax=Gnomoniopsis smithogilvyi TaxID=1191159 RepID=A0A9W9D298_9PEZI|nr:lipin Ned1 [Gnomoniopsis smithogilvyi]
MQYVRNISDSVSTAWNSINPSTLSGAIDVIVVEHDDGTLSCSPFHVRFGKFSLLRPSDKKVEFRVNGKRQDYAMKLGDGGEAFFVFETSDNIPQDLQTSPLVSPASSPPLAPGRAATTSILQDPPPLELDEDKSIRHSPNSSLTRPPPSTLYSSSIPRDPGMITPISSATEFSNMRPKSGDFSLISRPHSEDILHQTARRKHSEPDLAEAAENTELSDRSTSPPLLAPQEALERAKNLSKGLQAVNIPTHVTETGDLMLDMTGFKESEEDAIRAEILARKVLTEELEGNYDIGALFGIDEQGNLWIYSSEEAKDAAMRKTMEDGLRSATLDTDAISDPGYASDDSTTTTPAMQISHRRTESDVGQSSLQTPPASPGSKGAVKATGDPNRNYAKTLRLTSDQLKALDLKPGENSLSFTVNRATCTAQMYLWKHETPVVISDIDGTITKSDALGHLFNMVGRDWTHAGVAKLYSDIVTNGYNIMYLTSRSVGQADTTRAYLAGIVQEGYRLPRGPTILSPDRTMAALRREIYLRKPHVFKMATLRDIKNLYGPDFHPFYAGFGNRLTDQISYRTVDVPRTRIFTINSNAEVSLDLLSLNKLKLSYVSMTDVVDHYFPPVSTIVKGGGEEYTDFQFWRDPPLEMDDFSASDDDGGESARDQESEYGEDEEEELDGDGLADSYISRGSYDAEGSILSGDYDEEQENMTKSMMDLLEEEENNEEDADDEEDIEDMEEEEEAEEAEEGEEDDQGDQTMTQGLSNPGGLAPPTDFLPPPRSPSPRFAVKDRSAELITGMKDLTVEKDTEE